MKLLLCIAVQLMLFIGYSSAVASESAKVTLAQSNGNTWRVTFSVSEPTHELRFMRTPDDSRSRRWQLLDKAFVLAHIRDEDQIRRRDGELFSEVAVTVPATYTPLPKEYAPFAPFQDGGLLIYSGRFHACSGQCPRDAAGVDGPWEVTLTPPAGARVILDGTVRVGQTTWVDSGEGTKVYVGRGEPLETRDFISVIDATLPRYIGDHLSTLLPALMAYYADHLEPPTQKPMMFVSYDPSYATGSGNQGGVLSGQVFMHFYGPGWSADSDIGQTGNSSYSQDDIALFFAHEAAHLFQGEGRNLPSDDIAWIHEGGADAFALRALFELNAVSQDYINQRTLDAFDQCSIGLSSHPVNQAAAAGTFEDYYSCGLLMNLAVDCAVRLASHGKKDLFDFWGEFLESVDTASAWNQDIFLETVDGEGAPETAAFLRSLAIEPQTKPGDFLRQGLTAAGLLPFVENTKAIPGGCLP